MNINLRMEKEPGQDHEIAILESDFYTQHSRLGLQKMMGRLVSLS